jgi:natural product precursor
MKKLNKLQINPERILNNKELVALRGGYGNLVCKDSCGNTCYTHQVTLCIYAEDICKIFCPGYKSYDCADV